MNHKQQLVLATAEALTSYGYDVYLSRSGEFGFYTDGKRVVSFGGSWNFSIDFTGNYVPAPQCGTGWQIATEHGVPTAHQAELWISQNAPFWTGNKNPIYTTPERHLKTYEASCGYSKFSAGQQVAA